MSRNILIYENDLKFKSQQNINFNDKNIKLYSGDKNNNYDTINARLQESSKNNDSYLDLSHLELININNLFNNKLYNNIQFLFLNNNNLTGTIDLSKFINLISVDNNLST